MPMKDGCSKPCCLWGNSKVSDQGRGAQIFRVHNVKAAAQAVKVLWGVQAYPAML